jgi:spore germination protein
MLVWPRFMKFSTLTATLDKTLETLGPAASSLRLGAANAARELKSWWRSFPPPALSAGGPKNRHLFASRLMVIVAVITIGSLPAPIKMPIPGSDQTLSLGGPLKSAGLGLAGSTKTEVPEDKIQSRRTVAGWLPFWDTDEALRAVTEFPQALTEISPFWYEPAADGGLEPSDGAEQQDVLDTARSNGAKIYPTIHSADGELLHDILTDPAKKDAHIARISAKVEHLDYDGIDIDYENMPAEARDPFSQFIRDLATEMHANDKKLIVTVHPKTSEPGGWNGPQSHDYRAIGEIADQVRIMAYDLHHRGGPSGPIAPVNWVEKVVAFSVTTMPAEKIVLGVPLYGYDWPAQGKARSVVHDQVAELTQARGIPIEWDETAATPFFKYSADGEERTVWFENRASFQAKAELVKRFDLAGLAMWRLGREDKGIYPYLSGDFQL